MRFYNTAAELCSAINECPPLQCLIALAPPQITPTANRKLWIIQGHIIATEGRKKIREQLKAFATGISLKPADDNGMIACKLTLHAANRQLVETAMNACSKSYRMSTYNSQLQADIESGRKPENTSTFAPERRFGNFAIRQHFRNNKWRPAFTYESIDPASLSTHVQEKREEPPPQPAGNVTPFVARSQKPKTEKPGT